MRRGSLIPKYAQEEMERQDRERAERYRRGPKTDGEFVHRLARSLEAELEMVRKHGVSAGTKVIEGEEVVTTPIRAQRPWLFRWLKLKFAVINFFKYFGKKKDALLARSAKRSSRH